MKTPLPTPITHTHTLFVNLTSSSEKLTSFFVFLSEQNEITDVHNHIRSSPVPVAGDMLEMVSILR